MRNLNVRQVLLKEVVSLRECYVIGDPCTPITYKFYTDHIYSLT